MTGSATKQSILFFRGEMDCFVASLLAMTNPVISAGVVAPRNDD